MSLAKSERHRKDKQVLKIVICCDTDPDYPHVPYKDINSDIIDKAPKWIDKKILEDRMSCSSKDLSWEGIEKGIPKLIKLLQNWKNTKITWYLRSDWMLWKVYGNWSWPAEEFMDTWKDLTSAGHEIGWHPHLQRYDQKTQSWYQEENDRVWIGNCLRTGYKEIQKSGFEIKTLKMGWDFHNNFTMNLVNELGIESDLSANPGMRSLGYKDKSGNHRINVYDWGATKREPYYPSKNDYLHSSNEEGGKLEILEIPITVHSMSRTIRLPTLMTKKLFSTLMNKKQLYKLPLTLTTNEEIFRKVLSERISNLAGPLSTYIVLDFHVYDLLIPNILEVVRKNLESIEKASVSYGIRHEFLTANELKQFLHPIISERRPHD